MFRKGTFASVCLGTLGRCPEALPTQDHFAFSNCALKKSNSINSVPKTCECILVVVGNSQERLRNNPYLLPSKEGLAGRLPLHWPLQGESFLSSSCLIESVAPREPGIAQKCLILFLTYPRLSVLFCLHGHGAGVQNPGE